MPTEKTSATEVPTASQVEAIGSRAEALTIRANQVLAVMLKDGGEELAPLASDTPFKDFLRDFLAGLPALLIGCFGTATRAANQLRNPGVLLRARLFMIVRSELRENEAMTVLGRPLVAAILEVARNIGAAELTALAG